jgi:hypothetical protein
MALFALCGALACDDDEPPPPTTTGVGGGGDLPAGATAIVAIVNPVENEGHNTGVPSAVGTERNGIEVDAEPGEVDTTADEGLAVVGVPVAAIQLHVGAAPPVAHTVEAAGDIYDGAIGYDGAAAGFYENTPIRYAVGESSGAVFYDPNEDIATIDARLDEDDVIVVLRPGTYVGDLEITGGGVLLFGEGWSDRAVVIDGSVRAAGEGIRLRGLTITGNLDATGNTFGISFSLVKGMTNIPGNVGAFLRNVFCSPPSVPSSNVTLLDNWGIAPQQDLTPDLEIACAP